MQIQHPVNTELQSGAFSVLVGGFGAICAQQHLQAQQTIGLCDTLRAPCTQITQQTPGCMPQGKTVAARPASPCCGSGPGVSTPSQADAAGSFGTARAGANGDMADSRYGCGQPSGACSTCCMSVSLVGWHDLHTLPAGACPSTCLCRRLSSSGQLCAEHNVCMLL